MRLVFYDDIVHKVIGSKAQRIVFVGLENSTTSTVQLIDHGGEQYVMTVLDPSTALYRLFMKLCPITSKELYYGPVITSSEATRP